MWNTAGVNGQWWGCACKRTVFVLFFRVIIYVYSCVFGRVIYCITLALGVCREIVKERGEYCGRDLVLIWEGGFGVVVAGGGFGGGGAGGGKMQYLANSWRGRCSNIPLPQSISPGLVVYLDFPNLAQTIRRFSCLLQGSSPSTSVRFVSMIGILSKLSYISH